MDKITKAFSADVSVNDGERAVTAKISTIAVDRDGDVMLPHGCDSRNYQKNPVVMLMHSYYSLPIGKCVALDRTDDALIAKTVFAERPASHPAGDEWVPDTIFSLFQQGILKAFSVGFNPVENRPASSRDCEKYGDCRRVISKWEILEYSVVPIPANQEAIATAVAKGLAPETACKLFGEDWKTPKAPEPTAPELAQIKRICVVAGVIHPAVDYSAIAKAATLAVGKSAGRIYITN